MFSHIPPNIYAHMQISALWGAAIESNEYKQQESEGTKMTFSKLPSLSESLLCQFSNITMGTLTCKRRFPCVFIWSTFVITDFIHHSWDGLRKWLLCNPALDWCWRRRDCGKAAIGATFLQEGFRWQSQLGHISILSYHQVCCSNFSANAVYFLTAYWIKVRIISTLTCSTNSRLTSPEVPVYESVHFDAAWLLYPLRFGEFLLIFFFLMQGNTTPGPGGTGPWSPTSMLAKWVLQHQCHCDQYRSHRHSCNKVSVLQNVVNSWCFVIL